MPFSDDTLIIDVINVPGLHLLLGIVAKFIEYIEIAVGGEDREKGKNWVNNFLSRVLHVTRVEYQWRKSLNGNDSKKFIENICKLEPFAMALEDHESGGKVMAAISCIKTFNTVVEKCFGNEVKGDFEFHIRKFSIQYRMLPGGCSVTPKVHIVERHIVQFLRRKHNQGFEGCGLGHFSEQSFESIHRDWKLFWDNLKVGEEHPLYSLKLLTSVVSYNSSHI